MEAQNLIEARSVVKTYKGEVEVKAVRGIDLTINAGEFTAIVGPSGSGKTTFLNVISGMDTPTSGTVNLKGVNIAKMKGRELSDFRRDNIGFIFQAYNLIPVLTVNENVEYIMLLQGVSAEERRARVSEMLGRVGLKGYEDRLPAKLSGGQQQRVAVARAMVSKPEMILADEPTANLDSKTGTSLLDMMHELNKDKRMTFLFSTHDEMIMERADRVVVLRDGMVESDTKRDKS